MASPLLIAQHSATECALLPGLANRHGLITGATGTGKTVTLQKLAENFSQIGVPVFMADIKGDLSGISQNGKVGDKLAASLKERGIAIPEGRTLELTQNRMLTSEVRFMNFYPFNDLELIAPRPLLFIAGDKAHSREFSEDAYRKATGPKELFWVPGAGHVDLYDRANLIPWKKLTSFFTQHLLA